MNKLDNILQYLKLGWKPIPLIKNSKIPAVRGWTTMDIDEDVVRRWWEENPDANMGLLTGKRTGFIVLDIDGEYTFSEEQYIPPTVSQTTQSGGKHYLFKHPGFDVTGTVRILEGPGGGVDVRGESQQIVAWPSVINNNEYSWDISPFDAEPADAPEWLIELLKSKRKEKRKTASEIFEGAHEGSRNVSAAQAAGMLLKTWPPDLAKEHFYMWNQTKCNPPLPEDELEKVWKSISNRELSKHGRMEDVMEFEKSAIGGMIAFPDVVLTHALDIGVQSDDFFSIAHQRLFEVIRDIHVEKRSLDPVTITGELKKRGNLKDGLNGEYVSELPLAVWIKEAAIEHVDFVMQESINRGLIQMCNKAIADAKSRKMDSISVLSNMSLEIDQISKRATIYNPLVRLSDHEKEYDNYLDDLRDKKNVIPTGIKQIDNHIVGIPKAGTTLLMARSSHGKTMLAMNIGLNVATAGKKVYYMSLEISENEIKARASQILGGVQRRTFVSKDQRDREKIFKAKKELMKLQDRFFVYGGTEDLQELIFATQAAVQNEGVDLVIIENLDLIRIPGKMERWERAAEASNKLTQFLRKMEMAGLPFGMILLCQANRKTSESEDLFPTEDNIANSDQPFRDASMCFSVLDPGRLPEHKNADDFGIKCIKNNRGPTFFTPEWLAKDVPTQSLAHRVRREGIPDEVKSPF